MNKNEKNFIFNGYYNFENIIDKNECRKFRNYIKKKYKISKKIFFNEKEYLRNKVKKKIHHSSVLHKYNTDFIFDNKKFSERLEFLLGKNYLLLSQRVICSIPEKFYPKWINKYQKKNVPNLTEYLKPHYRDFRILKGADFHQDIIDHPKQKANLITIYIYLDNVLNNMAPLILLPKTHLIGPERYPHNLKTGKKTFNLISRRNKIIKGNNIKLIGGAGSTWGWHTCLLHGTTSNVSIKPRFSIRLIYKQTTNEKSLIKLANNKLDRLYAPGKMF